MNEEERLAYEILKKDYKLAVEEDSLDIDVITGVLEIILNLIEKQQKELDKKDKVIRLIAEAFKQDDIRSVDEIIEYFTKKVSEE